MRELGIDFSEVLTPFVEGPSGSSAALFSAFSPTAKVPCLHHDGLVVWETPAIAEYLAERHPGVWPEKPAARAFARSAVAEMHAGFAALRNICSMNCGLRIRVFPGKLESLSQDLTRLTALWREGLISFGGPFLAGDRFGAVDAFFAPVAFRVQSYGLELEPFAMAYVERLLALPSMREWYASALSETWRDPYHEADALSSGNLLEDVRGRT
jgi:glutathione S-transferase